MEIDSPIEIINKTIKDSSFLKNPIQLNDNNLNLYLFDYTKEINIIISHCIQKLKLTSIIDKNIGKNYYPFHKQNENLNDFIQNTSLKNFIYFIETTTDIDFTKYQDYYDKYDNLIFKIKDNDIIIYMLFSKLEDIKNQPSFLTITNTNKTTKSNIDIIKKLTKYFPQFDKFNIKISDSQFDYLFSFIQYLLHDNNYYYIIDYLIIIASVLFPLDKERKDFVLQFLMNMINHNHSKEYKDILDKLNNNNNNKPLDLNYIYPQKENDMKNFVNDIIKNIFPKEPLWNVLFDIDYLSKIYNQNNNKKYIPVYEFLSDSIFNTTIMKDFNNFPSEILINNITNKLNESGYKSDIQKVERIILKTNKIIKKQNKNEEIVRANRAIETRSTIIFASLKSFEKIIESEPEEIPKIEPVIQTNYLIIDENDKMVIDLINSIEEPNQNIIFTPTIKESSLAKTKEKNIDEILKQTREESENDLKRFQDKAARLNKLYQQEQEKSKQLVIIQPTFNANTQKHDLNEDSLSNIFEPKIKREIFRLLNKNFLHSQINQQSPSYILNNEYKMNDIEKNMLTDRNIMTKNYYFKDLPKQISNTYSKPLIFNVELKGEFKEKTGYFKNLLFQSQNSDEEVVLLLKAINLKYTFKKDRTNQIIALENSEIKSNNLTSSRIEVLINYYLLILLLGFDKIISINFNLCIDWWIFPMTQFVNFMRQNNFIMLQPNTSTNYISDKFGEENTPFQCILMEFAEIALIDYIIEISNNLNIQDGWISFYSVLFQIFHALETSYYITSFYHRDLHIENIRVKKYKAFQGKDLYYKRFRTKNIYQIKNDQERIIKIIDFGLSMIKSRFTDDFFDNPSSDDKLLSEKSQIHRIYNQYDINNYYLDRKRDVRKIILFIFQRLDNKNFQNFRTSNRWDQLSQFIKTVTGWEEWKKIYDNIDLRNNEIKMKLTAIKNRNLINNQDIYFRNLDNEWKNIQKLYKMYYNHKELINIIDLDFEKDLLRYEYQKGDDQVRKEFITAMSKFYMFNFIMSPISDSYGLSATSAINDYEKIKDIFGSLTFQEDNYDITNKICLSDLDDSMILERH